MCGITGYIDKKGIVPENALPEMLRTIAHRGPDDGGARVFSSGFGSIGLGHKRLSIIDLSPLGHQPMSFNGLHIVYNGEIYNYAEVREQLLQKGYAFQSGSDTEVLLKAFDCWGIDCLRLFIGMFAFCLYNENANDIYLVRDRVGVKPLYYFQSADGLVFGSELKTLVACPSIFRKSLSPEGLRSYFKFGYIPAPLTIYEHTKKLKPGHYLRYDLAAHLSSEHCYWNVIDYYNKEGRVPAYEEALEEVEKLLVSAFNYRMVSDVKNGVFLSGGYDSTALLALLQKNHKEKIKTFTIGFEDKKFNEAAHAKVIAEMFGTEHHEFYCTEQDAIEMIPVLPTVYDEPLADISCIPTLLLSRQTRREVTVALSADGGDEVFGGYDKYYANLNMYRMAGKIPRIAGSVASGIIGAMARTGVLSGMQNAYVRLENMQEILSSGGNRQSSVSKIQAKLYSTRQLQQLLPGSPTTQPETAFDNISRLNDSVSMLNALYAIDFQTFLPDDILVKVDRATMHYALEGREPLLDHRIIEYVASLPDNYKFDGVNRKKMLKDIVHKYVPKSLMDRPKQGFVMPVDKWMRQDLKDFIYDSFQMPVLQRIPFLNASYLQQTLAEFYTGKSPNAGAKVWRAFIFINWYNTTFSE